MIDVVITHKQRIVKTTNQIIKRVRELKPTPSEELRRETALFVRQSIDQVISDLSVIGGFCGKNEKNYIAQLASSVSPMVTSPSYIGFMSPVIEDWCTMVNSIIVDFHKTPFKFVSGEFKLSFRELETKIKAILRRI